MIKLNYEKKILKAGVTAICLELDTIQALQKLLVKPLKGQFQIFNLWPLIFFSLDRRMPC